MTTRRRNNVKTANIPTSKNYKTHKVRHTNHRIDYTILHFYTTGLEQDSKTNASRCI